MPRAKAPRLLFAPPTSKTPSLLLTSHNSAFTRRGTIASANSAASHPSALLSTSMCMCVHVPHMHTISSFYDCITGSDDHTIHVFTHAAPSFSRSRSRSRSRFALALALAFSCARSLVRALFPCASLPPWPLLNLIEKITYLSSKTLPASTCIIIRRTQQTRRTDDKTMPGLIPGEFTVQCVFSFRLTCGQHQTPAFENPMDNWVSRDHVQRRHTLAPVHT